jgi:hypothetical protein
LKFKTAASVTEKFIDMEPTCPACNVPLDVIQLGDTITVRCDNPRCPSDVSALGASGATVEQASLRLELAIEQEQ